MKILFSADCFYPAQMGGPSNAIYWQAKALTKAGHDVTVVATSQYLPPEIQLDRWLTLDCGRIIYTHSPHFYLPVKHIWYGWQAIRNADIVHVNSLFYPASLIWVLMSLLAQKPVVWSSRGELSPSALRFRSNLKRVLLSVFRRISSSIYFHATCGAEATDIRHQFGPCVQVAEIGNMMELPPPVIPPPAAQPYLLFIGRLHPIKAVDRLLDALSTSTLFRESNYSLLIAGPEADKAYSLKLKKQIKTLNLVSKVSFLGSVNGAAKEQLYAGAHVMVLPSHAENFGNVVIESLAQGTPVIAATGTPWQLLEPEGAGIWSNNQPDKLQQAIEAFLTMPADTYKDYRKRAIKLARRDYDIMANVAVWTQLYRQVLRDNTVQNQGLTQRYAQQ